MHPIMSGLSQPGSGALAGRRLLVVYLPNDACAPESLLEPLLLACFRAADTCRVAAAAESRALRALAREDRDAVRTPGDESPPLRPRLVEVAPRMGYVEQRILEDRFLAQLPLPGRERSGVGTFHWDRLQWCLLPRDLAPFVASLPWKEADTLVLLGGAADDPLGGQCLAAARARGLQVVGLVPGFVLGRYAPFWIHGCDAVGVADADAAEALAEAGAGPRVWVEPGLAPDLALAPLALTPAEPRVLHLELRMRTSIALVKRTLQDWLPGVRDRVAGLCFHHDGPYLENLREHFGTSWAQVPVAHDAAPLLERARRGGADVLAFEPWSAVYTGGLPSGTRVGVLGAEVRACLGRVPARLAPHLLEVA